MGLANKDWTPGVTQAVSGRAATEDQLKALEKDIQKATDDAVKKIDSMTAEKGKRTPYCLINRKIRRVGQKQKSMDYVSFLVRLSF